jgi:hypothetical protein
LNATNSKSWKKILGILPNQGEDDFLSEKYLLLGNETSRGVVSGAAEYLLEKFKVRRNTFSGINFGKSRLAVAPLSADSDLGCISCGKCLNGCQYDHIFNSGHAIEKLINDYGPKRIKMERGAYVSQILFRQNSKIELVLNTDAPKLEFDAVYLAAGAIGSAALLQRSSLVSEVQTFETPMTIIPSFLIWRTPLQETKISLSEVFVYQTKLGELSSAGQIYSLNEQLFDLVLQKFHLNMFKRFFPRWIKSRFLLCMFFMPPNEESKITMIRSNAVTEVIVGGKYTYATFREQLGHYSKVMRSLGFLTIPFINFRQPVGASYHFGMLSSTGLYDEPLIRANGTLKSLPINSRLYCIDGLSLRKLEPGPITLDLMLNSLVLTKKSLVGEFL